MQSTPQQNALTAGLNRGWSAPDLSDRRARTSHREWIAGQVSTAYVILPGRDEGASVMNAAVAQAWCDMLETYPQDVIAEAFREWVRSEKWRPTPSEIIAKCEARRPRPVAVPSPEPRKQICSPEASNAILAAAGFEPRLIERSGDE